MCTEPTQLDTETIAAIVWWRFTRGACGFEGGNIGRGVMLLCAPFPMSRPQIRETTLAHQSQQEESLCERVGGDDRLAARMAPGWYCTGVRNFG